MPTTARFKSRLYAHANKKSPPASAKSATTVRDRVDDATAASGEPGARDDAADSTLLRAAERSMSNLPSRGALLDPTAVAQLIFPGTKARDLASKRKWVRENVPFKLSLAHKTVGWFEADVRWWLEDRRNGT